MPAMELLSPRGLWLLAGLVPLVALYILKTRRDRLRVPSTFLWANAQRDLAARHPFRRLLMQVPLIVQALALVALAVALARPAARGSTLDFDHVAIVIDTSASMAARDGGSSSKWTRFDAAKREAKAILARLDARAEVTLIEAAREARIVTPFERDRQRVERALDPLEPREVEGRLGPALALAASRLREVSGGASLGTTRLLVITDGALADETLPVVAGSPIDWVLVGPGAPKGALGGESDNTGIVRVDARRGVSTHPPPGEAPHDEVQVFVLVQNFGRSPRDAYVTLNLATPPPLDAGPREGPLSSRRVLVPPGGEEPVVLTFAPAPEDEGAGLVAQLEGSDALSTDDRAYARVPPARRMPVVLASNGGSSWVERALRADAEVAVQSLSLAELATVNVEPQSLVVITGACPEGIPGGDVVVLNPPPGPCFGVTVGGPVTNPAVTSWEPGDSRLRFITLDGVHFAKARRLEAGRGSLVRAGSDTLVADGGSVGRQVTVVGFDVGDSDWPLRASFVLFFRNILEQARVHRTEAGEGATRAGEPLRVAVPDGVTRVRLTLPGTATDAAGRGAGEVDLAVKAGFAVLPATSKVGLYEARWSEPHVGRALFPVNLTSARESDVTPRPIPALALGGGQEIRSGAPLFPPRERAAWLSLLAAALVAFDFYWLTRAPRAGKATP